jgi:hypothetical protein
MAHLRGPSDAGYCAHTLSAPFRLATPSAPPAKAAQSWWRKAAQSWCICWGGGGPSSDRDVEGSRYKYGGDGTPYCIIAWPFCDACDLFLLARPLSSCSLTSLMNTRSFCGFGLQRIASGGNKTAAARPSTSKRGGTARFVPAR